MVTPPSPRHAKASPGKLIQVMAAPGGGLLGRRVKRALVFGICGAFIAGFLYIVYGLVFYDSLCCADDAYIAIAAKNLASGYGYASSVPVPYQGGQGLRLFDPALSTGPTLVLPAAALIKVFGATAWAPGLATALVTTILLIILTLVAGRRVGALRALTYVALMLALQYALTAGSRFASWYSLLGEVPAALLTVVGVAVLVWGQGGRRTVAGGFLALGLALMAKTLALLGAIPAGIWLVVLLVRSGGRSRREWVDLAVGAGSFSAPFLAFEAWKAVSLGPNRYLLNIKDFGKFLSSTGGGSGATDSASIWHRIVVNSAMLRESYGFGPLLLLVVVAALCLLIQTSAEPRTKTFCWLIFAGGLTHILYFVTRSTGNPRYALIGLLILAAGAACAVLVNRPGRAAVASAAIVALAWLPAHSLLLGPVTAAAKDAFRPSQRVQNLQAAATFLTGVHHDKPLVGAWWATVDDLEYMLPSVSNFVRVEDTDPKEMHKGRVLARNEKWALLAPSALFATWERTCDKVLFDAKPYLVTACPADTSR